MYGVYYSVCIGITGLSAAESNRHELAAEALTATLEAEDSIIARNCGTIDDAARAVRDKNKVAILEALTGRLPDGYLRSVIQEYRYDIELWEWRPLPASLVVNLVGEMGASPASTRKWSAPSDEHGVIAIICVFAFLFVVLWLARKPSSKHPNRAARSPYDYPTERGTYRQPPAPLATPTPSPPRGPAPVDTVQARTKARRIGAIGEALEGWTAQHLEGVAKTGAAKHDLRDLKLKLTAICRLASEAEGKLSTIESAAAARG